MEKLFTVFLGLLLLVSCSNKDHCPNRFNFISTTDSIPILQLNYSENLSVTFERMNELYGFDLCEKCGWVEIKAPFEIKGENGYLKVMADFNYPLCPNCPMATRLRNNFLVLINSNNQILAENNLVSLDSLKVEIMSYLSKIGTDNESPESFHRFNYNLRWDTKTDSTFINSIFRSIYTTHTDFVVNKLSETNNDFCELDDNELIKIKSEYPLRIQINSGNSLLRLVPPEKIEIQEGNEE